MNPGHTVLPFAKLNFAKFEAFMFETLSSGLRVDLPASKKPRRPAQTYRIINAVAYGGAGHKQKGIDFLCTMDEGSEWVFQAKLMPKFGVGEAKAAVRKARKEFQKAKRYILLVSGIANPAAVDYVRKQSNWEIWDGPTLTAHFLRRIPIKSQIENIGRAWPSLAGQIVAELYPLRDQLLVSSEEFFATWMTPDRLFHHRSTLVGHVEILEQLTAFVRDPVQRVAILVAPGGRGKSRVLRAFAERIEKEFPEHQVRFVDPHASPTARPESLRTAGEIDFIVVQDDAHRAETIRHDLLAILASTKGKLLVATRPQAVTALEHHLVRNGFSAHTLGTPIQLPKLKHTENEAIARAELDEVHRRHARFLAQVGRDCPLVITVGAALINRNLIPPDRFEEKVFQTEVFARFEGEELDRLVGRFDGDRVRRVLQTLAVLAPWQERDVDLKKVAAFVGCPEAELQSIIAQLEAGQLVVKSGRGRRVVPDLFADHLVYSASYLPNGQLSPFAQELAAVFSAKASQTMLRNLSEADWQAARYHKNSASLLDPFWKSVWTLFTKSNFFDRSLLIEKWGSHSVYQPARSLELARLAIDLKKAPSPLKNAWTKGKSPDRMFSHHRVLSVLPSMLEPIGVYHDEYRQHVLDLLLELSAIWPVDAKLDDQNHPWHVISRIAEFKLDHPLATAVGVMNWLDHNLDDPRVKPVVARPSKILAKVLGQIFARTLNASYSEGNTFSFHYPPLDINQTQPLREQALKLIEEKIIPHGEIAILNVLPVLESGVETFRAHFGGELTPSLQRSWQPERLKCLAVLERLVVSNPSARVRWRIRTLLRQLVRSEKGASLFRRRVQTLLKKIPLDGDVSEIAAICSHGWSEFDDILFQRGGKASALKGEIEDKWNGVLSAVARDLFARHKKAPALLAYFEREIALCNAVGLEDQVRRLLTVIAREDPTLAKACIEHLLKKESILRGVWTSLIPPETKFPDTWLEGICLRALASKSPPLISQALDLLSRGYLGPTPRAHAVAVGHWAKRVPKRFSGLAVAALHFPHDQNDPIWHAVAANLELSKLDPTQISSIAESVGRRMRHDNFVLPTKFIAKLLRELIRVSDIGADRCDDFLRAIGTKDPKAVLDLYLKRIRIAMRAPRRGDFQPVPIDALALPELPKVLGYSKLAYNLLHKCRTSTGWVRYQYKQLFSAAVLRVSSLGVPLLISWAKTARSMDELKRIASLGHFDGSLLFLKFPNLTLALLRRGRKLKPHEFPQWQRYLAGTMGPTIRSYTNNKRDDEQNYVTAEAMKLLSGKVSTELKSFYRDVVAHEESISTSFGGVADDED